MSSRIRKRTLVCETPYFKTQQSRTLLDVLQSSERLSKMPTYNNSINTSIPFYKVSPQKSSRYAECIRLNRSGYDVLRYSPTELLAILQQHQKAEVELEETIERVSRLSKQKKIWHKKLTRTMNRKIFNLKELKKMKTKKTTRSSGIEEQAIHTTKQKLADPEGLHPSNPLDPNDWFLPSDFALSSNLLADLGILRNIEIPSDIQSDFDWFLDIFAKVISFPSNKILFDPSLLLFVENNLHFVFLIECYLDSFFLYFG